MKATTLICCVFALALVGLSCTPEVGLEISVTEDSLSISVTEVDDGVMIENLSSVSCLVLVFVASPEVEHEFELAVGERVTVTGITEPIEVAAVGR